MTTKTTSNESAAAGKAGEPTAEKPSNLTAAGVADLLRSEFSTLPVEEETETAPGQEIPPAAESADANAPGDEQLETDPALAGEAENPAEVEPGESPETAEAGETEDEADANTEATTLPAEMQSALDAWEATGGPLPPALQKVVGKRIGKLTAERETEKQRAAAAESQLNTVAQELEALRNDPQRPAFSAPSSLVDEKQLAAIDRTSAKFLTEAENFLDGAATDEERTRIEKYMASERLDERGLKRRIREVNEFRLQQLPQQRQALQTFRAHEQAAAPVAKTYFGKLDDKASPEYAEAREVLQLIPELTSRTPAHRIATGTYVLGLKALRILQDAGVNADAFGSVETALRKAFPAKGTTAKPVVAQKPPPKAPAGNGAAAVKTKVSPTEATSQRFNKAPTRANATEMARAALRAG